MKKAYSILEPKDLSSLDAIKHGIRNESVAANKLKESLKLQYGENFELSNCGLYVHPTLPFLGASPDRILKIYNENVVVEIKCPHSAFKLKISPYTVNYLELISDTLCLKKTHSYYSQVQGQLACTNLKTCFFVVYTGDLVIIRVHRDEQFIAHMLLQLNDFYQKYFKFAVLNKYFYKSVKY